MGEALLRNFMTPGRSYKDPSRVLKTDRPQAYRPGGASQQNLQAGRGPPAGGYRLTGQAHFKVFSGTGKQAACEATGAHL